MSTEETKTLPTTPGWYARASEPLTEISTIWVLDDGGKWWFEQWVMSEEAMLDEAPLARLVMETDTAQRPEVDIAAAREEFLYVLNGSFEEPDDDFEAVLIRVLNGEFDK